MENCFTFTSMKAHLFIVKSHWCILDLIQSNFNERSQKEQLNFKIASIPVLICAHYASLP